jgi:hypothetical protein
VDETTVPPSGIVFGTSVLEYVVQVSVAEDSGGPLTGRSASTAAKPMPQAVSEINSIRFIARVLPVGAVAGD